MRDYILEIKKLIPEHNCKKIINYFDHSYHDAGIGDREVNKNIRNCLTKDILETKTFGEKICSNFVQEKIFNCVEHYQKKFDIGIKKISQLDILKYESNSHKAGYTYHQDFGDTCSERHLSISICLNNDFLGGEFVFDLPEGEHIVPQNIGDAVIFPSNFMFPHKVNKITEGTRFAIIGWVI